MPTNAIILANAPIACVLAGNRIAKGALFGPPIDPQLDQKIYSTYFIIKKVYDIDPNYTNMTLYCQYLWELMGPFGIRAQAYTGGGGSVAPPTSGTRPDPLDFIVSATSVVPTGSTGVTISAFIGWNLNFDRNNIPQSTTNVGGGASYYSWDRDTGTFSCSPSANADELFRLTPV